MGPERSLAAVGKKLGKSTMMMEKWSRKFDWAARVAAHGGHLATVEREAAEAIVRGKGADWAERYVELRESEWRARKELVDLAWEVIRRWRSKAERCGSLEGVARLLDLMSTLGRRACEVATEKKEVTGAVSGAIRIEIEAALVKIYGKPLRGEVVEVEEVKSGEGRVESGASLSPALSSSGGERAGGGGGQRNARPAGGSLRRAIMTTMQRYMAVGQGAGCPRDQMDNFIVAGVILQERQLAASAAARLCDRVEGPTAVGYGGARGGGKSHWLLAQMGADDCQRVPGLKCLLLRKVGKANMEHFEDLRRRLFGHLEHEFSAYRGVLNFGNGSRIIAGHFQSEKDIDAYLGLEYDVIGIEEATTLSNRKHTDISTCCRTSKPNWRPRIYSTSNPGGIGHAWYRTRFVVPYQEKREAETRFVPARVCDNAYNNPEYRQVLESLTGWQKRAWLDGDWDLAAGQFFATFRREVHVVSDFDETRAREWFAALDYGFAHYTVVLLGCTDGDGNLFIVDEHAERLWLPQRHAEAIRAMVGRHKVGAGGKEQGAWSGELGARSLEVGDLRRIVAGTDVFSRQSDGTTIANQYARAGIPLKPANMDRVNGWAEVLQRLGEPNVALESGADLRPRLFIHRRCGRLAETLPAMQHDPNRPEDVLKVDADEDGVGGDDAADALRYLVATRARTIIQRKLTGL